MAKTFGFLSVLMMAVIANADKHRLCACIRDQPPAGLIIDDEATKAVVNGSDGRFVYSDAWWYTGALHNAPHDGSSALPARQVNLSSSINQSIKYTAIAS
ncbi:m6 protein [Colletotrichum kahawae]|uniref:M6 protein n=1 Tax=Colletotrichum kahawae TaxID=34407 RepID=A0AAD9YAJ1_COLKA|nr:m6 protein [Colletotrichum kahawae]